MARLLVILGHSRVQYANGAGLYKNDAPFDPLRPNNDLSQTSHCNIKGLSAREVMRIENMITQVQVY